MALRHKLLVVLLKYKVIKEGMCMKLFYSFMVYSILGWLLEVVYHLLVEKRFVNRGFLHGPICPIYGTTAVLLIIALTNVSNSYIYIFIIGAAIASIVELIVGYILDAAFSTKWWDYSDEKLNIKGYICLKFSAYWGIISIVFMKIINPAISKIIYWITDKSNNIISAAILTILAADIILTINSLIAFRKLFAEIQEVLVEIRSNMDKLVTARINKENISNIHKRIEYLREVKEKLVLKINLRQKGLLRAYPHMNSNKFGSAIEEIKRKIKKL